MREIDDTIEKLISLNLEMIKKDEINKEYADRIIELKNDYERKQEELKELENWGE